MMNTLEKILDGKIPTHAGEWAFEHVRILRVLADFVEQLLLANKEEK